MNYLVQFNSNDFKIGGVVSAEMPYNPSKHNNMRNMTALLLNKAIAACRCDTILLPRYQIIKKSFSTPIIKVTGRAATFREN